MKAQEHDLFRRSGIRVGSVQRNHHGSLVEGAGVNCDFVLPEAGIYTLEGENQSGKSLLIKALMGVRPTGLILQPRSGLTKIDDREITIIHVADALANGIVAVFQDDNLIASMTVEEQLLMRHASPRWQSWVAWSSVATHASVPIHFVRHQFPWLGELLPDFFEREENIHVAKEIKERALAIIKSYGKFEDILYMYPRELSGGAKAVARLVSAQLTPGIKVLFLDEAMANVGPTVWPGLVDALKQWQVREKSAIVVVTHNESERAHWAPQIRFTIKNNKLTERRVLGSRSLTPGAPARESYIPTFHDVSEDGWLDEQVEQVFVLIDKNVLHLEPTLEILARLEKRGLTPSQISLECTEVKKSLVTYTSLVESLSQSLVGKRLAFVIVGGGVAINLGLLIAGTLHRGIHKSVVVPTTIMAIADVAVGSKAGVNTIDHQGKGRKHTIGIFHNPSAIVLDKRFIKDLPEQERILGLSECLKHALLQDQALFDRIETLLLRESVDYEECYEIALSAMKLKSRILVEDFWELNFGQLLLYGHLHAHSFERASSFTLPHGLTVFLGILIELELAGDQHIRQRIHKMIDKRIATIFKGLTWPTDSQLEHAYSKDNYFNHETYRALQVLKVGCYKEPHGNQLDYQPSTWDSIRKAIALTKTNLQLDYRHEST